MRIPYLTIVSLLVGAYLIRIKEYLIGCILIFGMIAINILINMKRGDR